MTATVASGVAQYVESAAPWMSWNLFLAIFPWTLAVVLRLFAGHRLATAALRLG